MLDARMLRDLIDTAQVVPACYAAFEPIVADALAFFLEHLSQARIDRILHEQTALPLDAPVARRLVRFMQHCPALHKLGQVLARHRKLDIDLRQRLQKLESMSPRTPIEHVRQVVQRELGGRVEQYGIHLGDTPLAEASVAVVAPCTWRLPDDKPGAAARHAVLKILKPDAAQHLEEDLGILARLADHLDERRQAYGLPPFAYRETLNDVADLLSNEIQLRHEQMNLRLAARQFAAVPGVQIPQTLPFCTDHITAMDRVFGRKITELDDGAPFQRQRLAATAVRALLAGVIFSSAKHAMFHADPHAGNLMATDNGRLAILDWSLTGQISASQRTGLSQMIVAALARDNDRLGRAIDALATTAPDAAAVRQTIARSWADLGWNCLPGPNWIMNLLDRLAATAVRFPPELLMLRKSYFTLEGVISDIGGGQSIERLLIAEALSQLAGEWPARAMTPLHARYLPSRISNADLIYVAARAPLFLAQCWSRRWRAMIRGGNTI